jgi:hypothetical protein
MARKQVRRQCSFGEQCPSVDITEGGDVEITGYELGAERTPENERTVVVPGPVLPEIVALDIPDFPAWRAERLPSPGDMLRVQTLDRYGAEDEYVRAYHAGEPGPTEADLAGWGAQLDAYHDAGQTYRNLHVINGPLSAEMQMQFGWGYTYNTAHHMQVRVLDVTEHPAAATLLRLGDYWVIEGMHVARCLYDGDGRPQGYVGVEAGGAAGFTAAAEMAWELGTDFATWWAAHPEYHRAPAQAA